MPHVPVDPAVTRTCSRRLAVWISCVKLCRAVIHAALRRPSPSTTITSPTRAATLAAGEPLAAGARVASSPYSSVAAAIATA